MRSFWGIPFNLDPGTPMRCKWEGPGCFVVARRKTNCVYKPGAYMYGNELCPDRKGTIDHRFGGTAFPPTHIRKKVCCGRRSQAFGDNIWEVPSHGSQAPPKDVHASPKLWSRHMLQEGIWNVPGGHTQHFLKIWPDHVHFISIEVPAVKNVNCKHQTQRQGQSHVIFWGLRYAVIPKKPHWITADVETFW